MPRSAAFLIVLLGLYSAAIAREAPALPDRLDPGTGTAVVVFLSARCPCSRSHEDALRDLARRHADVRFVGIHSNQDEPPEEAAAHFAGASLGFPVHEDSGARFAESFGAVKTPHVFVLKNRKIVYEGGVDDSHVAGNAKKHYLAEALEALGRGAEPDPARTRTLGCVIRR